MDSLPQEKTCTKCGEAKSLTEFHRQKSLPDGHKCYCKPCCKAINAARYEAKREELRDKQRSYYLLKSDEFKARAKKRYQADPEKWKREVRAWQSRNREKASRYKAKWTKQNPNSVRETWRRRHARKKQNGIIPFAVEELLQKVAYWGWRCWICGVDWEAIDHVKPINKGGMHALCNLRPVCRACNTRKRDRWPLTED